MHFQAATGERNRSERRVRGEGSKARGSSALMYLQIAVEKGTGVPANR